MKWLVLLLVLLPLIFAKNIIIKHGDKENSLTAVRLYKDAITYQYGYASQKVSKFESGKYESTDKKNFQVVGTYSYENDGTEYKNIYKADKNGFIPKVSFGVKNATKETDYISIVTRVKGIDGVLLCSLIGSGCK